MRSGEIIPDDTGKIRYTPGRPRGKANAKTIELSAQRKKFRDRVARNANKLYNAQYNLAVGESYLMRKVTERNTKGSVVKVYHEIVTNPKTIIAYLDGELEGNESLNNDNEYYYITTRGANNMAIDSMLDRAFGKADQKIDVEAKLEVMHIHKPEKLALEQIEVAGESLRNRAIDAVEAEILEENRHEVGITARTADVRALDS